MDAISHGEACFIDIIKFNQSQAIKPQENFISVPAFMTPVFKQCTEKL